MQLMGGFYCATTKPHNVMNCGACLDLYKRFSGYSIFAKNTIIKATSSKLVWLYDLLDSVNKNFKEFRKMNQHLRIR